MAAYGLRPITGDLSVSPPKWYPIADGYTGNIFSGDFVERLATGYIQRQETTTGLSPVAADPTLGVAVGFKYIDGNGQFQVSNRYPGSALNTKIYVAVCDDPNQLYLIQSDGNTTFADVGDNATVAGFAASAGSTVTGNSGIYLSHSTIAQTALTLRIVGIRTDGANENLTSGKDVIVKILPAVMQNVLSDQIP